MCRYAMSPYKTHFACLGCGLSAKHYWDTAPRCRSCAEPMTRMGHDFHAPRKNAIKQWEKLRLLVEAGFTFHSCGCSGPGWRPSTLAEAKTLLKRRRVHRKHGVKFRKGWMPRRELLDA